LVGVFCQREDGITLYPKDFERLFSPEKERILQEIETGKKSVTFGSWDWEVFDVTEGVGDGEIYKLLIFVPLNREMTHIYSMIIHELKNPIAAIRAMVQVMETSILEGTLARDKLLQYSSLILEEIDRMNRLLSSIIKLAKPRTKFQYRFDLVEEVKKAMGTWSEEFRARGIKMVLVSNVEKVFFLGNPDEIHQIINNLLRNSREALEGVKKPRVEVNLWDKGSEILLTVKDNGRGIPPDVLQKIKTSFYSSKPHGLGLGLFVVKSIVRRYRGTISINSEPGKGCEVVVRFPKR